MKAVVLAGGKGTRLAPYTKILPKPLMPIGDLPILEVLLKQMKRAGVDEVILTVGHLAELIRAFFQDGKRLGRPLEMPLTAIRISQDLFVYANSINLAALPETGQYSIVFEVTDPDSDATAEREVELNLRE